MAGAVWPVNPEGGFSYSSELSKIMRSIVSVPPAVRRAQYQAEWDVLPTREKNRRARAARLAELRVRLATEAFTRYAGYEPCEDC